MAGFQVITEVQRPSARDISVIIPAYRASAYIGEALESVVAQAAQETEIIVINDGSPDTEALERALQPYKNRIVYLKQENGGVSSARNTGIQAARREWLAFLDADDVWAPTYLEVQLAFLREHAVDMVFPNAEVFGETRDAGRYTMDLAPFDGEITFQKALAGDCTILYCALVRREIVIRAGLFDTGLRGSEDFNLWLRILRIGGRIGYHRTPVHRYRKHDGSLTSDAVWMAERILQSLDRAEESIPMSAEEHAAAARHRRKVEREIAMLRGRGAFKAKNWAAALDHYDYAYRLSPSRKLQVVLLLSKVCPGLLYSVFQGREKTAVALRHT
jgi:glycosyltransferase involved in cell wall biosynthesis